MSQEILINYNNVVLRQQGEMVLTDLNLQLHQGEFVYLIGKVGTGKSTFLKSVYAEVLIREGEAKVLDYDMRKLKEKQIPLLRRKLGIIFQDFQLLMDRSVHDNLWFVLKATGWKDKEAINNRIHEVLQLVDMEDKARKFPNELSGGQQQRVVIARAVLNKPQIILADEPTGHLDLQTGCDITELLHKVSEQGTLVVMSTHNLQMLNEFPGTVYRVQDHHINPAPEYATRY